MIKKKKKKICWAVDIGWFLELEEGVNLNSLVQAVKKAISDEYKEN